MVQASQHRGPFLKTKIGLAILIKSNQLVYFLYVHLRVLHKSSNSDKLMI